jgi:hypothetical protein
LKGEDGLEFKDVLNFGAKVYFYFDIKFLLKEFKDAYGLNDRKDL